MIKQNIFLHSYYQYYAVYKFNEFSNVLNSVAIYDVMQFSFIFNQNVSIFKLLKCLIKKKTVTESVKEGYKKGLKLKKV